MSIGRFSTRLASELRSKCLITYCDIVFFYLMALQLFRTNPIQETC